MSADRVATQELSWLGLFGRKLAGSSEQDSGGRLGSLDAAGAECDALEQVAVEEDADTKSQADPLAHDGVAGEVSPSCEDMVEQSKRRC